MEKLYTPKEVAKILGVNIKTIYRLIKSKGIMATKPIGQWRIKQGDLDKLIK